MSEATATKKKKANKLLSWFKGGGSGEEDRQRPVIRPNQSVSSQSSDSGSSTRSSSSFRRRSLNIDGLKAQLHAAAAARAREPVQKENLPVHRSNDFIKAQLYAAARASARESAQKENIPIHKPNEFQALFPKTFPLEDRSLSTNQPTESRRKAGAISVSSLSQSNSVAVPLELIPRSGGQPNLDDGPFLYEYEIFPYLKRSHPSAIARPSDSGGHPAFASRNIRESDHVYSWSQRPDGAIRKSRSSSLPKQPRKPPCSDIGTSVLADDECSLNCSCQPCLQSAKPRSKSPRSRNSQERPARRDSRPTKPENKIKTVAKPWYDVPISPMKVKEQSDQKSGNKTEDSLLHTSLKEDLSAIIERAVKTTIEEYLNKTVLSRNQSSFIEPHKESPPPLPKRKIVQEPIYGNIGPPEMASVPSIESVVESVLKQYGILPREDNTSTYVNKSSEELGASQCSDPVLSNQEPSRACDTTAESWPIRKVKSLPGLSLREEEDTALESTVELPSEDKDYTTCSSEDEAEKPNTSTVMSPARVRVRSSKYKATDLTCGRAKLKVAIYHNSGLTTVHVIRAFKLTSHKSSLINPYVKVCLLPFCYSVNWRTRVKEDCHSPTFDEKCSFELADDDNGRRIIISVWSRDFALRKSEFLGCISFSVRSILARTQDIRGWYRLLTPPRTFRTPPRRNVEWRPDLQTSIYV